MVMVLCVDINKNLKRAKQRNNTSSKRRVLGPVRFSESDYLPTSNLSTEKQVKSTNSLHKKPTYFAGSLIRIANETHFHVTSVPEADHRED